MPESIFPLLVFEFYTSGTDIVHMHTIKLIITEYRKSNESITEEL